MRFFCVVDKAMGQEHSFVDGMLRTLVLARNPGSKLVLANGGALLRRAAAKEGVLESAYRRKGVGRLLFPIDAVFLFVKVSRCGGDWVVFVRNEPLVLLFFQVLRSLGLRRFRLYFQTSFPHERRSGFWVARWINKLIFQAVLGKADRVFVLSTSAADRVRAYGVSHNQIRIVPVCVDFQPQNGGRWGGGNDGALVFLYIGSIVADRRLDTILEAFEEACKEGVAFQLRMVGCSEREFLNEYPHCRAMIGRLLQRGGLVFRGRVSRSEVVREIAAADVGINLIPPTSVYKESTSTKLGEYLSQGKPAMSSKGIPFHEWVHSLGSVGWLVEFDKVAIKEAVVNACALGREELQSLAGDCVRVIDSHLRYESYYELLTQ